MILVLGGADHERDALVGKVGSQGGSQGASASRIVRPIHDHERRAAEQLEAAGPACAVEAPPNGRLIGAERAGRGGGQERVAGLEDSEQSTADVLDAPARALEIEPLPFERRAAQAY